MRNDAAPNAATESSEISLCSPKNGPPLHRRPKGPVFMPFRTAQLPKATSSCSRHVETLTPVVPFHDIRAPSLSPTSNQPSQPDSCPTRRSSSPPGRKTCSQCNTRYLRDLGKDLSKKRKGRSLCLYGVAFEAAALNHEIGCADSIA